MKIEGKTKQLLTEIIGSSKEVISIVEIFAELKGLKLEEHVLEIDFTIKKN